MLLRSTFAKSKNYYFALVTEFFAPIVSWYYAIRLPAESREPTKWARILILGEHHIGDVLCRTCSLDFLAERLPNCELYYATSDVSSQLLTHHPNLKAVLPVYTFDKRSTLKKGALKQLRQLNFDAAICTASVHYWSDLLIAVRAGIPNRVGFVHKGFSGWVTHPSPLKLPSSFALSIYRQFASLVNGSEIPQNLRPRIYTSETDRLEAQRFMDQHGLIDKKNIIAIFPFNRQPIASWPDEYYVKLCKMLCEENFTVILAGAKSDASKLQILSNNFDYPNIIWTAGDLTLRSLCVFISKCKAVICMDSGPRHISNAAGVPVFFFRNARAFEQETGVYCDTEIDLLPPGELLDPDQQKALMQSVSPEAVFKTFNDYF